ncbi:MAG: RsmB/NOP family class I SAM-dependent RNA methyltransferase [Tannerellaceae bacterium]|nr:RsmB/NOP family class I SAM-dependent RNA methyltransferase [Tannerellaceae bacterium]
MQLPLSFTERMSRLCGDETALFFNALEQEPPVSIRVNPAKLFFKPGFTPVPWCETGYYLPERFHFTFDPLFHAGGYYVQEASSMFLEQIVKQYVQEPVRCLDLCAAPGGKTTHLLSLLPAGSLLVSNEVIRTRSQILSENVIKWGSPDVIVTNNDPAAFADLTGLFDVIVTDVPCSGEGMFRKDPDSINEWSEANVNLCAFRQQRIIHDIWNALAPGGLLVYSTCTYNIRENEENIQNMIRQYGAEVLPVNCLPEWNISGAFAGNEPVYRFLPHKTPGEGFFIAVLRKPDRKAGHFRLPKNNSRKQSKKKEPVPGAIKTILKDPDHFMYELTPKGYIAFPSALQDMYTYLKNRLHIVSAGLLLGEVKGTDFIPGHSLATSQHVNPQNFEQWELTWKEAISYLRKEQLSSPTDKPKGYLQVCYKGLSLGFVKNLGNHTNNLYPNEWRIRSGYLPDDPKTLL